MGSEEELERVTMDYFKNSFTSSNLKDLDYVLDSVDICITLDIAALLQETFKEEEVLESFHQIHPTKAASPFG